MNIKRTAILMIVLISIVGITAASNSWDKNTLAAHHYDSTSTIQSYNQTDGIYPYWQYVKTAANYFDGNTSFDNTGLNWFVGHPFTKLSTDAVDGNYSAYYSTLTTDLLHEYRVGAGSDYKETPYISDFDFGTSSTKNFTTEGWVKIPAYGATNTTLFDWRGNGTSCGGPSCTSSNSMKYNGTAVGLDRYGFITVWYSPNDKIFNSTQPIGTGAWKHFAVLKNGTSLQIYNNGRLNGTSVVGTTYNFSAGYWFNGALYDHRYVSVYSPWTDGLADNMKISNISRYGGNFTPSATNLLELNNATTLYAEVLPPTADKFQPPSDYPSGPFASYQYAYGDFVPYTVGIGNLSDTKSAIIALTGTYNFAPTNQECYVSFPSALTNCANGRVNYNSSFTNSGFSMIDPSSATEPAVPDSVSHIYENPMYPPKYGYYLVDDQDPYDDYKRTFFWINTSANKTFTTKRGLFDLTMSAGEIPPVDSTNLFMDTGVTPPLRTVPAYSSTFEYTSGGINTLKFQDNRTSPLSYVSFTDAYGYSTAWSEIDGQSGPYHANVGETVNFTIYISDVFLSDDVDFKILYNKSEITPTGSIYRPGTAPLFESNTTLQSVFDTTNGEIDVYAYTDGAAGVSSRYKLITVGYEQPEPYVAVATIPFTVITATPVLGPVTQIDFDPDYTGYVMYERIPASPSYMGSRFYDFADEINMSLMVDDDPLTSIFILQDLNTGSNVKSHSTFVTTAREASPSGTQDGFTGQYTVNHKGGTFTVAATADGYYPYNGTISTGTSGTHYITMTPFSGPNTQTWYSPHQVTFRIMDMNDNIVKDAFVNATAYESTLPGGISGATDTLVAMFGINAAEAGKMVSAATNMQGYSADDGSISFTMHGSLKYRIVIDDGVNQYTKSLYPLDTYYILRTTDGGTYTQPQNQYNRGSNIANTTLTFSEPNNSYMTMGVDYQDLSGNTDYLMFFVKLKNNETVIYAQNQSVVGAQRILMNKTVKNNRGEQWLWWYNAHTAV